MAYLLLIVEPPGQREARTELEGQAVYASMLAFGGELTARGVLLASQSLTAQASGARVQVRSGQVQVTDGPFAEAKEMVGGFFMLSCATRAEALEIAAQCPAAEWATVEVRELGPCFM